MYLRWLSDLHVDVNKPKDVRLPALPTDPETVLALPGDFGTPKTMADWLNLHARTFPYILLVLGNHDHWGFSRERAVAKWQEGLAKHLTGEFLARIVLLENEWVDLAGVRFFGTTLWSDFSHADPAVLQAARLDLQDYKRIRTAGGTQRFQPRHAVIAHDQAIAWLQKAIAEPFAGPKIVLTHFAPSRKSLPASWADDPLGGAYANSMEALLRVFGEQGVRRWLHGHIHTAAEYRIGQIRVSSNPFGYPGEQGATGYRPDRVEDLAGDFL
ncbi:metallophosphoesterase [Thiomonas sp.]